MPTILDATVVASAYDTSGNGGRKLVRLSNGNLISIVKNGTTSFILYKSTDNGSSWAVLATVTGNAQDVSLVTNGTYVYVLSNAVVAQQAYYYVYNSSGTLLFNGAVDSSQTAFSGNSLTINSLGTELHATWASKNATYPNSFNIRYAKGTIATDGSVSWGAVEQITTHNNATYANFAINPTVTIDKNGVPLVIIEQQGVGFVNTSSSTTKIGITVLKRNNTLTTGNTYVDSTWSWGSVYQPGTYTQSSPSAIFVPQSVNGLANGRIWVAWHGYDATQTTIFQVRVSYSDDGGVTWSAMQKLTTQSNRHFNPSTSYDDKNNIYVYMVGDATTDNLGLLVNSNGTWGAIQTVHTQAAGVTSPSAIEFIRNTTRPPVIFMANSTVKFYGTWTVTTISVTQGSIGTKTSPSNVLTYAITTDGTMSTITEKVNGVTIGTKTATSGEVLISGLSQAQWDAVKFGKYKDVTAGLNTLTIEMGTEIFTYTFDKRPASDADMLSVTKAVQDSANVSLPAKKSLVATAIRAKGGTVLDTDSLEVMAGAVGGIALGKKWASGVNNSSTSNFFSLSGLPFTPRVALLRYTMGGIGYIVIASSEGFTLGSTFYYSIGVNATASAYPGSSQPMTSNGFSIFIKQSTTVYSISWEAYE